MKSFAFLALSVQICTSMAFMVAQPYPNPIQSPGYNDFLLPPPVFPQYPQMGNSGMQNMMLSIILGPAPQGFNPFPQQPISPFLGTVSAFGNTGNIMDNSPPNMWPSDFLCGTTGQPPIDLSEFEKLPRHENIVPFGSQNGADFGKKPEMSPTAFAPAVVLGGPPARPAVQPPSKPGFVQAMVMPKGNPGVAPSRIY